MYNMKLNKLLLFLLILVLTTMDISPNENEDLKFLRYQPMEGQENLYLNVIEKYLGTDKEWYSLVALQRVTAKFKQSGDFSSAINLYKEFRAEFKKYRSHIDRIIEILEEDELEIDEINLGNNINTEYAEYSPVPNSKGDRIYFTAYKREFSDTEDIFVSELRNGQWQNAVPMREGINTRDNNEAPQCITTDDNILVIFGNYEGSLGKGDLFFVERVSDTEFGEIQHFPEPINSEHFDCDARITNDGKAMIFVSDRPGAIGGYYPYDEFHGGSFHGNTDIYVSFKTANGWSKPINLGPNINTPYAERKPFLHPDGMSLYFSSEGHPGIGGLDLFVSRRLSKDSWTEWSEPVNFGKQINSTADDRGAIISTFGDLSFFATGDRALTFGSSDIFTMKLPQHLKPMPVVIIKGKVMDTEGNPLNAKIIWEDLERNKQLGEMRSNPETGEYFIIFPAGVNYGFFADKIGYFPISLNIDLREQSDTATIERDIIMQPLDQIIGLDLKKLDMVDELEIDLEQEEKKLKINNLFFQYRDYDILNISYPELDRVVYFLNQYPQISLVEISGHTDNVGGDSYNQKLSEKRANQVRDYLISKGISASRLVSKGYGKNNTVADNDTEEGRKENRRVELKILKISLKEK